MRRLTPPTYNLPVAITRCGNFYGGGDLNWNRVVPGTIRSILRGERPVVRSDGKFVRDYFYIEDGAAAYMLLAERLASDPALRGQAFNFSNESQVSVLEMVDLILRKMDSSLRPEVLNQASNEIRHQFLSAERARTMLNWQPAVHARRPALTARSPGIASFSARPPRWRKPAGDSSP